MPDYQPWISNRPLDELTPREIEAYCKDHLGLVFEGKGPDDLPFKTVAKIISQYLVEHGTWGPVDSDDEIDSPVFGKTLRPTDGTTKAAEQMARENPVAMFGAVNRLLNDRGLMITIGALDDDAPCDVESAEACNKARKAAFVKGEGSELGIYRQGWGDCEEWLASRSGPRNPDVTPA